MLRQLHLIVSPDTASAGTATCCTTGTRRRPARTGPVGRPPFAASGFWCCAWLGRSRAAVADAFTANWSPSASRSLLRRSGRSSTPTGSSLPPTVTTRTWAAFLRSQAHAVLAADFFETRTLTGARLYLFVVIERTNHRVRGVT